MRSKIIAFPGIKGSCVFNNCVMHVLRIDHTRTYVRTYTRNVYIAF